MDRRRFLKSSLAVAAAGMTTGAAAAPERGQASAVSLLVLGTAQDGGLPHPGCACPNCRRARLDPAFSRRIASLAILDRTGGGYYLVDATPDIRAQMEAAGRRLHGGESGAAALPAGVLLTHAHIGHYPGLMFFGYEAASTEALPVHCSRRMADFLKQNGPWSQLVEFKNIIPRPLTPGEPFQLNPRIRVTGFPVPHRDEFTDTLGFEIAGPNRSLLYIPDIQRWSVWQRRIEEEAGRVDIALLDGTFFDAGELPGRNMEEIGHPLIVDTLRRLGPVVRKDGTRVLLTHLNHGNPAVAPESGARRRIREAGLEGAEDGMEIAL